MAYTGICRCGIAAFEVEDEVEDEVTAEAASGPAVDLSRALRLWTIPHERLRPLAGESGVGAYTFNETVVGHRFCGQCGMHLYGEQIGDQGARMAYVNLDCIDQGRA